MIKQGIKSLKRIQCAAIRNVTKTVTLTKYSINEPDTRFVTMADFFPFYSFSLLLRLNSTFSLSHSIVCQKQHRPMELWMP